MSFKFAHMSDCHLGSWSNHPEMKDKPLEAFEKAIETCISENVDFIIIAGDLLDTSLPGVDVLKRAATVFRRCRDAGIPVYIVAGSHDYSPTGKTMLSVFENAGLIIDVAKYNEDGNKIRVDFTIDEKTGAKIVGVFGKKGSLEVEMFERLEIPDEEGPKIFVFHCGIDEHRIMKGMSSVPVSLLPDGFDYYATGHIHVRRIYDIGGKKIGFPGPLFPTSFDELEDYNSGFYIIGCNNEGVSIERKNVKLFDVLLVEEDATDKAPHEIESTLMRKLDKNLDNTLVLIKIHGTLKSGKPADIDFKAVSALAEKMGAIAVKKNINKLVSTSMEEVEVEAASMDEIEKRIVAEHSEKMKLGSKDSTNLIISLMNVLKDEKGEDETNATFEGKIKENSKRLLGL